MKPWSPQRPIRIGERIEAIMKRALHPIFFWAIGCALLGGCIGVLTVVCSASLSHAIISPEQIRSSASFGALLGSLTGMLISYLRGSGETSPTHKQWQAFDIVTVALIALLIGSTFYLMVMG
jgi:hypothetical protein